jgi:thiamine transport system substrate-binding protein
MRRIQGAGVLLAIIAVVSALGAGAQAVPTLLSRTPRRTTITLMAHDSFAVSKSVLAAFTKQTGITVKVLPSGDAGAALNQAILTKSHPLGDVFFGVDNTYLSRALSAGIFERYAPAALSNVLPQYQLDPSRRLTPIDHGDVCINYDKRWFAKQKLAVPTKLTDLVKPAYKGLLVVENPATSSPGLAFQLATIAKFGTNGWRAYWSKLRSNGVKVDDGWESAYDGDFSQGANAGTYPLVVSYASSPPAAVYYSKPQPKTSPVGTMLSSCFRQVEFAGVMRGTAHVSAARKLVDFMLTAQFQSDIPLQMFVFPVREGTKLPVVFTKFAEVVASPLSLPARQIGARRDAWINQWTDTVLR